MAAKNLFTAVLLLLLPLTAFAADPIDPLTLVSDTQTEWLNGDTNTWQAAVLTTIQSPLWPQIAGANWIWNYPIATPDQKENGDVVTFRRIFELDRALDGTGKFLVTADNEVTVKLNGQELLTTICDFNNSSTCLQEIPITGQVGTNTFEFIVTQYGRPGSSSNIRLNLAGLVYKATFETPAKPEPIVIVPGMLASISPVGTFSEQLSNFWIFTPGAHGYYKSLLEQFLAAGYRENEKVFVAHYNWRKPVDNNVANYLKPTIDRAKQETGSDKVDIVAHSMGGLVARSYIQGESYENDVDQLITLGTPHQGASDAYVAWEGGRLPITWDPSMRGLIKTIEFILKETSGLDLEAPLSFRTFFPALKDLLPITDFVTKSGTDVPIASLTEQNSSLKNLQAEIDELENRGIDVTAIIGNGVETLGTIDVTTSRTAIDAALERWRDGHPSQDPVLPNSSGGDARVLAASATIGNDIITLSSGNHEKLPHLARKKILETLGIPVEEFQYEPPDVQSLLGITILSPIDPTVTCGSQVLSKNENTFGEAAQYIADPSVPDAPQLLLIGNPPEGKCTATLIGTGSGKYHAITCFADEDQDVCTVREGTTSAGKNETYSVGVTPDSFQPPVGDVVSLLRQLKASLFDLLLDHHIKVAGTKLHGMATRLLSFGEKWEKAAKKSGENKDAKKWNNKVKSDFAAFSKELDAQIKKNNLDATALVEIVPLRDQLKDAGL